MQIRTDAPREGARSPSTSRSVGASDAAPGDFLSLLGGVLEAGTRERPSAPVDPKAADAEAEDDAAPVAETAPGDEASAEEVEIEETDETEEAPEAAPGRDVALETPGLVVEAPLVADPALAPVAVTPSLASGDEVVESDLDAPESAPVSATTASDPAAARPVEEPAPLAPTGEALPAARITADAAAERIETNSDATEADPRALATGPAPAASRTPATAPVATAAEADVAPSLESTAVETTPTAPVASPAAVTTAATEASAPRRPAEIETSLDVPVDAADLEVVEDTEGGEPEVVAATTEADLAAASEGASTEDGDAVLPRSDAAHRPAAARGGEDAPALERAVDPAPAATARPAAASAAPGAARPEGAPSTLEIRDLTEQIRLSTRPGVSRIQLVLEPVELGRLVIRLSLKGQHLVGQVSAESAEVLQTLRENLPALRSALAGTGVAVEDFSFEHRDSRSDREAASETPRTDPGRRRAARIFQATERVGAALPRVRVDASDGLNIWV
ncbi:MAG: flagellar hook-length control protein FliK [Planctomycetota bacterium]